MRGWKKKEEEVLLTTFTSCSCSASREVYGWGCGGWVKGLGGCVVVC